MKSLILIGAFALLVSNANAFDPVSASPSNNQPPGTFVSGISVPAPSGGGSVASAGSGSATGKSDGASGAAGGSDGSSEGGRSGASEEKSNE